MNDKFLKDCQQWSGQKSVSFSWKLKHWMLFPTFRIIVIKRMAESASNPLWKKFLSFQMMKMSRKYLITMPLDVLWGGY